MRITTEMTAAFDRLSSALQHQIFNSLGWRSLRPVQELSIGPILDGDNVVVLAPTAGGKTEAAIFPLLSMIDSADWRPMSVLYIAPLRALLNNQEQRLESYARLVGRTAFKWHGDVDQHRRRSFLKEPADLLMTTPESLEVMLMSERVSSEQLFRNLRAVVIDEIHAFAGDDRGGHLSAVLERLSRHCGRDVQRIGLSATVGNPEEILAWAAGSSQRPARVVRAPDSSKAPKIDIDYVGNLANAAKVIAGLHQGKKRLVFADSRRAVESLGQELRQLGVDAYVTHSSLSRDERRDAEYAFELGRDCVIVATSALELGIDIGDLDHVLQIDSPTSVASFLQRMGRTGRRDDMAPNCTFLATTDEGLWTASAIVALFRRGFVESVSIRRRAAHLLAHQLMALAIQEHGIRTGDWWAWLEHAAPFQALTAEDRAAVVAHMIAEDILIDVDGRYTLGEKGEKRYGFRNFSELYAVFSTPRSMTVMHGHVEVGSIDASFAQQEDLAKLTFSLGARAWRAIAIDWESSIVRVEPSQDAHAARWFGRATLLSSALCGAICEVLTGAEPDPTWSQRARERMASIRLEHSFLAPDVMTLEGEPLGYRLWTFAGGRANNLLARVLEAELGEKVTSGNLAIRIRGKAGESEAGLRTALRELAEHGRPTDEETGRFVNTVAKARLSKFEPCLPERLLARHIADYTLDATGARAALAMTIRSGAEVPPDPDTDEVLKRERGD